MKYFYAGGLIWFKAIFFAGFFLGFGSLLITDWDAFALSMLVFFGGIGLTWPLLLIIVPLVKLSVKIPYSIPARIAWLTFYLVLLVLGFYMLLIGTDEWSQNDLAVLTSSMYTILVSLFVAVYTSRKRLIKLNNENINQTI